MPRRLIAVVALAVTVLLVGAGSLYAFDRSVKTRIAEGVTVNGVDVGGMKPEAARAKLQAALVEPLDRPVVVRYEDQRFKLTRKQAAIAVDVDGSVDRAMAVSTDGNMFTRTWREVRGRELDEQVEAKIAWDRAAVRRLVDRVTTKLTVEAQDASVELEAGQVEPKPSRDGLAVKARRLRREIKRELLDTGEKRLVRVRTEVVKPKVTTADLAKKYPAVIVVNRGSFQLNFYKGLKLAKSYGIAVGQVGLETPAGLYHIQNKAVNPAWHVPNSDWAGSLAGTVVPGGTPQNPLKARWMGIYAGAGIHGTDATGSIGTAASHGCIRMLIPDVIELYDQVPVGAPIYIA
ncbi:MAG TPA: L,D-transpeptidase/peptidoglycan binding protein [Solirubrobacteraceae bacterium]|jgi:lipoprotein-anchoring transpeptidase ErfK/SrfK|nr:L,D-transpeptidase/peptidoglycan binding protein [Solirubrobacteraceae bacterium]